MIMTETKCFICNSRSARNHTNPRTSNTLADELSAIFLLRNVFELPSWIIQKYLISSGAGQNPSQWLSVCTECDHNLRKIRTFYEQFLEADRKFRRAKYELVRKMKESLPPGFTNCASISEECRQFVQLHDYAEPPKNPFKEGDHRARELLGVAVDFDVANSNVKMEAFESTEENHLDLNLVNVTFDHKHHTNIDLGCSQDLSLTPEGHDYDDSDGGGDYYDNNDDDDDDDDDYAYLPPGPKCRKIEAAAKSETSNSSTKTKTDPEPRSDEMSAAQASNLVQFLTTFRGRRMVCYDGHHFYNGGHKPNRFGLTHFNCKWRQQGCLASISLRNYNNEDATFTGFLPNLEAHDHSGVRNESGKTRHAMWYEVNSLAQEIVKDNVNAPTIQVLQMVKDSFMGDPEVTAELSKKNVHQNLSRAIRNMKRKLGWKPEPGRRRLEQAPVPEGDESQSQSPETNNDIEELTFDQASKLIQFLTTLRGRRMVLYDGLNFYHDGHKPNSSGLTHFNCKWRQNGCVARLSFRNYDDDDATFTGFIPNLEAHDHSGVRNESGKTRNAVWYEVNSLAQEIVKDNVDFPTSQVLQMVKDSFIGDPEVTEEMSKKNVHRNLTRTIRNMKRKLGWKPSAGRRRLEQAPVQEGDESQPPEVNNDIEELTFDQASNLIQFLTTSHSKRMVRYDGLNFYHGGHKRTSSGFTHFYCKWRQQGCMARISLRNYNDADATFTGFIPNLEPHSNHSDDGNGRDMTKHGIWYEVNSLAQEIVKDNVNAPVGQVFQMIQDSFMGEPEVTEELMKENVQRNLKTVIRTMKRKLGWIPDPKVRPKVIRRKKKKRAAKVNPSPNNDNPPIPPLVGHTVE